MLFDKVGDMKIISKATNEEECIIGFAQIKFNNYIDGYFVNNDAYEITIDLEDEFLITIDNMKIDKVNFNYDNINNSRPYKFDFVTVINKIGYQGIIDDAWINNKHQLFNTNMPELSLKTRVGSKLVLTKMDE